MRTDDPARPARHRAHRAAHAHPRQQLRTRNPLHAAPRSPHRQTRTHQRLPRAPRPRRLPPPGLAPDSTTDRIFLARAATLRKRDIWPWLQDTYLTPQAVHAPGTRLDQAEALPTPRKPGDLPGLRIIRLREAADRNAVAHLFGVPYDEQTQQRTPGNGRFSGLIQHSDTVFYGLNPRPDQNQTPLDVTKLDPSRPQDATWSVHNPRPLEIVTAFLQDDDNPAELAMYVQALRRSVLHTTNGTVWPWLIHCADLMTEYLL